MSAEHYLHHDASVRKLIAEAEVRGAVRALREAADDMQQFEPFPGEEPDWLRDRADRIEAAR